MFHLFVSLQDFRSICPCRKTLSAIMRNTHGVLQLYVSKWVCLVWLMESSYPRSAAHLGLQLLSVGLSLTSVIQMLRLSSGYQVHCMLQLLYTTAALHLAQLSSLHEECYFRQPAVQAIKSLPNANVLSLTLALSVCSLTQMCLLDFANRWLLWLEAEAYDLKYKEWGGRAQATAYNGSC